MASSTAPKSAPSASRPSLNQILSLPPRCLAAYDDFIAKNAGQVSQIESALRSRFRDAEIASESIHSGVQLLSLYHDILLRRVVTTLPLSPKSTSSSTTPAPTPHARYTKFWTARSKTYRRVALLLQMVIYTELLCEMGAKRRGGEKARWGVVVLLEAIKALCRLILLRVTRSRPLVSPVLPEREPVPEDVAGEDEFDEAARSESELMDEVDTARASSSSSNGASSSSPSSPASHDKEWAMPRTGASLPSLPNPGDISNYLLSRVLTADDIKPAFKLLNRLRGSSQAAEVLHILTPLFYALALARSRTRPGVTSSTRYSWTPWLLGVAMELAARQLRDRSLRATALEREEWGRRGWAMGWWAMRGAFYENVTKGWVKGVSGRMPGFVAGILDDYEYLWENYYFSTSA
ncbi:peroxisomal membrane protein (Pex16) domain-containing protein [Sarocladium implicatum]|nr:peroxisomal membrane protein (Pex16) domain-containing protein [Sarocladium implicatum]